PVKPFDGPPLRWGPGDAGFREILGPGDPVVLCVHRLRYVRILVEDDRARPWQVTAGHRRQGKMACGVLARPYLTHLRFFFRTPVLRLRAAGPETAPGRRGQR